MTILQKISYKQKKSLKKITEDNLYLKKAGLIKKNDLKKQKRSKVKTKSKKRKKKKQS